MGLEVDAGDIEKLLEDHWVEQTTEELEHLQKNRKSSLIKLMKKKKIKKIYQVL